TRLICHFRLDMQQLGEAWDIDFHHHFSRELERLDAMAQDGLLTLDDRHIEIAPKGRFLIRNICMVFDAYLGESTGGRFSKVI
ncbi:MAG: coproporphyrinogen III oxidase, partial [Sedimenticolaceae bacterium]|nr:coproporphyrinogen III oxidase [Sedimenticolaceae bacterium]